MLKLNISKTPYQSVVAASMFTFFLIGNTQQLAFADAKPMAADTAKDVLAKAPVDADFKKLDANADDKISLKEAVKDKTLATSFDLTDVNKDGSITTDEYASYKAAGQVKSMDSIPPASSGSTPPTSSY
jgi:hypothetical protein